MSNSSIVNQYLGAFYSGKFQDAEALVADNFDFKGPFIEVVGRTNYFAAASRLRPIVAGHNLLKQWVDRSDVCSVYEMILQTPITSGTVLMSEWNVVLNGKISQARLTFDTAAFRKIVPVPPPVNANK